MGQGATTAQRLTKLKKQGSKAAASASASSGQYVASSRHGTGTSTTTPTPPPAAFPGCGALIAAVIAALASLVGVSRRELGALLSPEMRESVQSPAGYSAQESARMSDETKANVRTFIERTNTVVANPDGGEMPTSGELLSLARTLHRERVYGLAIEMAKQAPQLIPPDAAPIEYFRAERDAHLLLYEIYRDRDETEPSEYHEAQFFRFDAAVNQLVAHETPEDTP